MGKGFLSRLGSCGVGIIYLLCGWVVLFGFVTGGLAVLLLEWVLRDGVVLDVRLLVLGFGWVWRLLLVFGLRCSC